MDNLIDISDFSYDFNKSLDERKNMFLEHVKNPYCFRFKDHKVVIKYTGEYDFESCLANALENIK